MKKKAKKMVLIAFLSLVFFNLPARVEDGQTPGQKLPLEKRAAAKVKPAKSGFGIGLRLYGGLNFFDGGDINDSKSNVTLNEYVAGQVGVPYTIDKNDLNRAFQGGADLLFYFGKRFGVSLGASYLKGKSENRLVITQPGPPPTDYTITFDPVVSAVPVTLGLFFTQPLGRRFSLLAEAGGGWTFARLAIDQDFIGSLGSMQFNAEGKAGGPCIFARLGLEVAIARNFFFFVEALGRYGKIRGFEGSYEVFHNDTIFSSGSGRFYTFDRDVSGHPVPFIDFADEPPSGALVSNVSETQIDFSGVSAHGGFRIRF
jgi:hypothetical protein